VRAGARQAQRFREQTSEVTRFTAAWEAAGVEMKESRVLIALLNERLSGELVKRKFDLDRSRATAAFMNDEQKSVVYAMGNVKSEIEKLHGLISKSSMRYFIEIKPIHSQVVADVPAALTQYFEQKEREKQRLIEQKAAAAAAAAAAAVVPPVKATAAKPQAAAGRRRTAGLKPTVSKKIAARTGKQRKSGPPADTAPVDDGDEEE
jgi:hypothetical protein